MQPQKSVLLADEDQGFLLILNRQFQDLGIKVITATDGLEALMLAATDAPDLIILDSNLPGANGFTICEKLGQNASTSGIPVVILADDSDAETERRCTSLGAYYIYKDLKCWDELGSVICEHMGVVTAPADLTKSPNEAPAQCSTPRILVIDDDPQVTRALKIRLGAIGLEVIEAPNASGGTYLAWTERPDLIITDQNMPEMSGEALIVKLKNDPETKDIPIIVITGQTVSGQEDFGLKRSMLGLRGAVAYLTKPVDFNELVDVLRVHIRIPSPSSGGAGPDSPSNLKTGSERG